MGKFGLNNLLGNHTQALTTMPRPSDVDDRESLLRWGERMEAVAARLSLVFPTHPGTRGSLEKHGLWQRVEAIEGAEVVEPLVYLDFLHLLGHAVVVITDLGGIQEESAYLQVPCLAVRENTERPATVEFGTNELVPLDPDAIADRVEVAMADGARSGQVSSL